MVTSAIRRWLESMGTVLTLQFSLKISRMEKFLINHRAERLGITRSKVLRRWSLETVVKDEPRWIAR